MDVEKIVREEVRRILLERYMVKGVPTVAPRVKRKYVRVKGARGLRGPRNYTMKFLKEIKSFVVHNPDMGYEEVGEKFGLTPKTVGRWMIRYFGVRRHRKFKQPRRVSRVEELEHIQKDIDTRKKVEQINKTNSRSLTMRKYWDSPAGVRQREILSLKAKKWWAEHPKERKEVGIRMREARAKFKNLWNEG